MKLPPPSQRLGVALTLLALASSCRSSGESDLDRLPYHVALVPPTEGTFEDEIPTSAINEEDASKRIEIKEFAFPEDGAKGVDVSKLLRRTLEDNLFTRVTPLQPPEGGGPVRAGWWASRAKLAGADLLLEIDQVTYDSRPATKGRPWNYFWFLTGPLVYAFEDRDYRVQGTIEASLYELQSLPDVDDPGAEDLTDYDLGLNQLVRKFRAKPDWVSTKFGDRVEGSGAYLMSLLLPTSQLEKDSVDVRRKIATKTLESMADALVNEIAVDSEFVTRPDRDQTFYMAEGSKVRLSGKDALVLDATLWQREESYDREFKDLAVRIGRHAVVPLEPAEAFEDLESDKGGWVRRRLRAKVPPLLCVPASWSGADPPVSRTVQLVATDRTGDGQTRSWTLSLDDDDYDQVVNLVEDEVARGVDVGTIESNYRVPGGAE